MSQVLGVLLGLTTLGALVASGVAWYHGSRARRFLERAQAAEAAVSALRSVNDELRASLARVVADVAAQHEREAEHDARMAADASTDASRAADLLNGLHANGSGSGRPAGP